VHAFGLAVCKSLLPPDKGLEMCLGFVIILSFNLELQPCMTRTLAGDPNLSDNATLRSAAVTAAPACFMTQRRSNRADEASRHRRNTPTPTDGASTPLTVRQPH
jgi:hypothetical protein